MPPQKVNSSNHIYTLLTHLTALMKAVEKAFSFVDSSLSSGIIINIILAVVIRAPMKLMWFMLNTLQILTHMPMLSLNLPTNLYVCLNIIK